MKRNVVLTLLLLVTINVSAQDVVVKKDGSTILAKVLEVNQDNIRYKKFSNPDGPTYTIGLSDVMAVNYENGEKDTFNVAQTSSAPAEGTSAQKVIERKPSSDNQQLIAKYNKPIVLNEKKKSNKLADKYILVFGMSENSVLSNEDIEVTYRKSCGSFPDNEYIERITYCINIRNKTNRTIYIDKAHCFRIPSSGTALSYFSTEQVSVTQSRGSGTSVGLGGIASAVGIGGAVGSIASGISVGSGSSGSVSSTYSDDRILAIPPSGNINMREDKYMKYEKYKNLKSAKYKLVNQSEVLDFNEHKQDIIGCWNWGIEIEKGIDRSLNLCLQPHMVELFSSKDFTELDTPFSIKYILSYSFDVSFANYYTANFSIYLREIIGCKKYKSEPQLLALSKYLTDEYIKNNDNYVIEGYFDTQQ